jgi:hypothetical protein
MKDQAAEADVVPSIASVSVPSDKDVDTILANELNSLSFHDRNRIQEEIHGVETLAAEETPERTQEALIEFQRIVDQTHPNKKQAYARAINESTTAQSTLYVQQDNFRLKFLRAALFDVQEAVTRYLANLDLLHKYFGPYALQRPLKFTDLPRKEQETIRAGYSQILPTRDRAGRLVIFDRVYAKDGAKMIPRAVRSSTKLTEIQTNIFNRIY